MYNNPVGYSLLGFGVVLLVFVFRDRLFALFGWRTPAHAHRLVRGYLDTLRYSVKQEAAPPEFVLTIEDTFHRKFGVSWEKTYGAISIGTRLAVPQAAEDVTHAWTTATPAEIRSLYSRLMEVGGHSQGVLTEVHEVQNQAMGFVRYKAVIPRDLISFEEFSNRLNNVEACFIMALGLIGDLWFTLKERQEMPPPPNAY